jgi:ATP-dependent Clp protease ATP-binding subunit ClpC
MFERFTARARRVLVLAQEEARLLGHGFIGTEHLLLGLLHEGEGLGAKALESLGITLEAVRTEVERRIGPAGSATDKPPFTPRAKKVLELALREALQLGHNLRPVESQYIGTEHLLLAIVREGEGVAAEVLESLGAELSRVRETVVGLVAGHDLGPTQVIPQQRGNPPRCPRCGDALEKTLRAREISVSVDETDRTATFLLAYCGTCGIALRATGDD